MTTISSEEPAVTEIDPVKPTHIPLRRLLILIAVEQLQDSRIEHIHTTTGLSCSQKTIQRDLAALMRQGEIGRTRKKGAVRYHTKKIALL